MDYNKATELDPEEAMVYKNHGMACQNSGDLEQAVLDFEKYLELAPNAPDREEVKKMILNFVSCLVLR